MGTCGLLLFLTAVVVGSAQLVSAQVGYPGYPGYNQFYGVSGHASECESDSDCRSAGYRCQFAPVSGKSYCTPSSYMYPYSSYYGYGGYPYDYYGYYGYGGYPYGYDYYGSYYPYSYGYPYNYGYYGSYYPYYNYGYYYPYYGHPYVGYTGEGTAEPRQGPPPTLTPEQLEEVKAKHEEMRKKAEEFWRSREGKEQLKPGESLEDHVVPMGGEWLPPPPPPSREQGEEGNHGNQEERRRWMPPRGRRPPPEEQVVDDGIAVD